MDQQQARTLVKETFQDSFDKNRFVRFTKELLNTFEDATFTYTDNYIPDAFEPHVSSLERIGKYSSNNHEIDILVVKLKRETSIERARTMQRNFIAWYLKGSRGGKLKDAALVAFVSSNHEDWRFSLVKMDYHFEQGKDGKVKVKEDITPARRWSFLVGKNENSHTAQSRLAPIIADEYNPTLPQLEEAFNIERVTKEFFEKYRNLFILTKETLDGLVSQDDKLKDDFHTKGVNTVDFAKKLLGQIVFLYFLQKKGWFGVARGANWGVGSKNFLRELFESRHGYYNNFFNDILEPLFYEALRLDRSHDSHYYYSRFNCRIPFLNGGLFDPIGEYDWVNADILFPNEIFSNTYGTKEGDIGTGILDVFDRYNFTVREDEPLEKEVAVDPELLGKAYEKFNAIRPDNFEEYRAALKSGKKGTETKFNREFGVYYTPREIVHYMCQQSLIQYLSTELDGKVTQEEIEAFIKSVEQAGENEVRVQAYGKETDTYAFKLPVGIRHHAALIDEKLVDIKVCDPAVGSGAFPVGMMADIIKVRSHLSPYIADAEPSDRNTYAFKRQCIENSLYGVDIDPGAVEIAKLRLWLSLIVDEDDIKNIKPLPNLDYKIVCGNSLLGVEKTLFNRSLFDEIKQLKQLFFNETVPQRKVEYRRRIDNLIGKITDGHREFDFEVHFSEVIEEKNGFDVVIGNPPYVNLVNIPSKDRNLYKTKFTVNKNKVDLYAYFIEGSEKVLKDGGNLTFIVPHTWKATDSFSKFRKFIFTKFTVRQIVNLEMGTFEATVIPLIIVLTKRRPRGNYQIGILDNHFRKTQDIELMEVQNAPDYSIDTQSRIEFRSLFKRIERNSIQLQSVIEFTRGIKTSDDKRFVCNAPLSPDHKKVFRGKNIKAYSFQWGGEYIWYRPDLMKQKIGCLPHTKDLFEVPEKLVTQRVNSSMRLLVAFDDARNYFLDTTNVSKYQTLDRRYSLKFIISLLNSKLINFWYCNKYRMPTIGIYELHSIPVIEAEQQVQRPCVSHVDSILCITREDDYPSNTRKQSEVHQLEREIDQLVYEMYGLTDEEIAIVERDTRGKG
jgi:hypothetical protein